MLAIAFVFVSIVDLWLTLFGLAVTGGRGEVWAPAAFVYRTWGEDGLAVFKLGGAALVVWLLAAFPTRWMRALVAGGVIVEVAIIGVNLWTVWPALVG